MKRFLTLICFFMLQTNLYAAAVSSTAMTSVQVKDIYKTGKAAYKKKQFKKALALFQTIALQEQDKSVRADAQAMLGKMYLAGEGTEQDLSKAFTLYKFAIDQNDSSRAKAIGQYGHGRMYLNGDGVPQDKKLAVTLLQAAAKQTDCLATQADAQLYLTMFDYYGFERIKKNEKKAFEQFEALAKQGHSNIAQVEARAYLAEMYHYGRGVTKDPLKALPLLTQSAFNDKIPRSQVLLARMYMRSDEEKNATAEQLQTEQAFQLLSQAANQEKDQRAKIGARYCLALFHASQETSPNHFDLTKAEQLLIESAQQDLLPDTKARALKLLKELFPDATL